MILSNGLLSASQINSLYTFDNLLNASQIKGNFTKNLIGGSLGNENLLSYIQTLINSFKTRVANEVGTFEAEDCLFANLTTLDDYQVDTNAQIVRDYATRVRADGGVVEGFENTISSVKKSTNQDLYDRASLSLFPSGIKAGKAYSILPTNGAGDFDVTRNTTKTRKNRLGLIETVAANVPSLNYDSVDDVPSILLEPQRTNLLGYSEDFTQGIWIKQGSFIDANVITSPSGVQNASLLRENTATQEHTLVIALATINANIAHTYSGFFKNNGADITMSVRNTFFTSGALVTFNLLNGTSGSINIQGTGTLVSSSIEPYINGYYKCSITVIVDATSTGLRVQLILNKRSNNSNNYLGDGVSGVYIWGQQLEQGSYATSYIPTLGSAVTRNQDLLSKTGISDLIGQNEGVLFIESIALANESITRQISISDGTADNIIVIGYGASPNQLGLVVKQGPTTIFSTFPTIPNTLVLNKIALLYKSGNIGVFVNGVKIISNVSTFTYPNNTFNTVNFNFGNGANRFLGKLNQLQLYKTALTDAECITLTS
jgi:hypothetical protein